MRRKDFGETTKHTLNLYTNDFAQLQELYPEIGASLVIRKIVRQHIEKMTKGNKAISVEVNDL